MVANKLTLSYSATAFDVVFTLPYLTSSRNLLDVLYLR